MRPEPLFEPETRTLIIQIILVPLFGPQPSWRPYTPQMFSQSGPHRRSGPVFRQQTRRPLNRARGQRSPVRRDSWLLVRVKTREHVEINQPADSFIQTGAPSSLHPSSLNPSSLKVFLTSRHFFPVCSCKVQMFRSLVSSSLRKQA